MTILLSNLSKHKILRRFIHKSIGGWLLDHFHDVIQALRSGSSILIAAQTYGSILEKVALPDWFMQTSPSILIISIPISMSKPNSRLSTTRTWAFTGLMLFTASVIVPTPSLWRIPLNCQDVQYLSARGIVHWSSHESTSAMCFLPLATASFTGFTSFNLIGERVALTFPTVSIGVLFCCRDNRAWLIFISGF